MRVCCQLPSCSVVPLPLSLPEKRLVHLPPSSFSPHLFSTSDSIRNFPVTSGSATAEKVWVSMSVVPSALSWPSFRFSASSLPCFSRQIPSPSQTLSLFHLPPDLRCSFRLWLAMLFSCWLLALVLLIFPCCWACSSHGHRTRVASFLLLTTGCLAVVLSLIPLNTGSLAVVLSLIPPASLCGSLQLPRCLVWNLQHHYVAVCHCVIVGSR